MKPIKLDIRSLPRAVVISVAVLVLNIAGAVGLSMLMDDMTDDLQTRDTRARDAISAAQRNLRTIGDDVKLVQEAKPRYEALAAHGVVGVQDRLLARHNLEHLRETSQLSGIEYTFEPAIASKPLADAVKDYDILRTNVQIGLRGALDQDVFDFIRGLGEAFPGAAVVEKLEIKRVAEPTPAILAGIARGEPGRLIDGTLKVAWRVAVPPGGSGKP